MGGEKEPVCAWYADFFRIKDASLCVDDDEGATKVLSSLLAGVVHAFVHSS